MVVLQNKPRSALQVESLHLYIDTEVQIALVQRLVMRRHLQLNLQMCSATLTELYLEPLQAGFWFDESSILKVKRRRMHEETLLAPQCVQQH